MARYRLSPLGLASLEVTSVLLPLAGFFVGLNADGVAMVAYVHGVNVPLARVHGRTAPRVFHPDLKFKITDPKQRTHLLQYILFMNLCPDDNAMAYIKFNVQTNIHYTTMLHSSSSHTKNTSKGGSAVKLLKVVLSRCQ